MSDPSDDHTPGRIDPAAPRAPPGWTLVAGLVILGMGLIGLYRGFSGVEAARTSLLGAPLPGIVAPQDAAPATPLTRDAQWSTLSGPKVLPPPPPKAASPASDDSAGASDSAAENDAAAVEAEPPIGLEPPAKAPATPDDSASQAQPGALAPF